MADRARAVQEDFESRQASTADALEALINQVEENEARKQEQAEKGIDALTYFVFKMLVSSGVGNADEVSRKIKEGFVEFPNWRTSENALRELRKKVTYAIFAECDDLDQVTAIVEDLFNIVERTP